MRPPVATAASIDLLASQGLGDGEGAQTLTVIYSASERVGERFRQSVGTAAGIELLAS